MSLHQTTEQNHKVKAANKAFENWGKLKYLGTTVTNQIAFTKKLRTE
jgi:hypothetical protein